jgi:hypothetical protein
MRDVSFFLARGFLIFFTMSKYVLNGKLGFVG